MLLERGEMVGFATLLGKNAVGWKNVARPSRPRSARHLRKRHFSDCHQGDALMLKSDPAPLGRVSKQAGLAQRGEASIRVYVFTAR
jgi:hypothetical protein